MRQATTPRTSRSTTEDDPLGWFICQNPRPIGPTWQIETDHERTSEVDVRFIAETPQRTRVELEHRHLERHGDGWEGVRAAVTGDDGWPLYLRRVAEQLAKAT